MWWDTTKDYMNAIIGVVFIIIGLIAIPEIRAKKKYWIPIVIAGCIMAFIGVDKINRDNKTSTENNTRHSSDTSTIHKIQSDLNTISSNYHYDTLKFSEFKKELFEKFKIKDSANSPVYIINGKQLIIPDNHGKMDIRF